jgi:hypothetical protein
MLEPFRFSCCSLAGSLVGLVDGFMPWRQEGSSYDNADNAPQHSE